MNDEKINDFKNTLKGQILEEINKTKKTFQGNVISDLANLKVLPLDAKTNPVLSPKLETDVKSYLTSYREYLNSVWVNGINDLIIQVLNEIIEELAPFEAESP